jgi:hypothetical protein
MSCSLKSKITSAEPMCQCGVPACLKTSFTEKNFGRFYGCVNYDARISSFLNNCLEISLLFFFSSYWVTSSFFFSFNYF